MSNALNVTTTAIDIIAALADAKEFAGNGKAISAEARVKSNKATLSGYAQAMVAVRTLMDQGLWTTGRQKKGVVSASQALKEALATEAKAKGVSPATAKRLIEKSSAILAGERKIKEVAEAATQSADQVLVAMEKAGLKKETDITLHVVPKMADVPLRILKAIAKLTGADRKKFIEDILSYEIIDDILAGAAKTPPAQRREAAAAVSSAAAKAAEARKAKAEKAPKAKAAEAKAPKAKAVPKSGASKKGASTKAKADAASDPFAN